MKNKLIPTILTIILLWQNLLWADELRPRAAGEKIKILGLSPDRIHIRMIGQWDIEELDSKKIGKVSTSEMEEALRDAFIRDGEFLQEIISRALKGKKVDTASIKKLEIIYFQEGPDTAIFQVKAYMKDGSQATFCLSVMKYLDNPEYDVHEDYIQVQNSWLRHPEDYPEPYAKGDGAFRWRGDNSLKQLKMMAMEWIGDSVELNYYPDFDDKNRWKFKLNYYSGLAERNLRTFPNHLLGGYDRQLIAEEMVKVVTKDYLPSEQSMIGSLSINSGDFVIQMLSKKGDFRLRLITIRKRQKGVSTSDFISTLLNQREMMLVEEDGVEWRAIYGRPFQPPRIVFHGILKGLIALHGETEGRRLTREWLKRYRDEKRKYVRQINKFLSTEIDEPIKEACITDRFAKMLVMETQMPKIAEVHTRELQGSI